MLKIIIRRQFQTLPDPQIIALPTGLMGVVLLREHARTGEKKLKILVANDLRQTIPGPPSSKDLHPALDKYKQQITQIFTDKKIREIRANLWLGSPSKEPRMQIGSPQAI